jgi:hypothetical protein
VAGRHENCDKRDFDSDVEERCWHAREAISYGNLAEAEETLNQLAPVNLFDIREWIGNVDALLHLCWSPP